MEVLVAWNNNIHRLDLSYQWGVLKGLDSIKDVDVTYLGKGWETWQGYKHWTGRRFDAVIGYDYKWSNWLKRGGKIESDLWYHVLGDYFPFKNQQAQHDRYLDEVGFDKLFARGWYECGIACKRRKCDVHFLPFDVDPDRFPFTPVDKARDIDVACLGSNAAEIFQYRKTVMEELEQEFSGSKDVKLVTGVVKGNGYVDVLQRSKLFVVVNSCYGNVSPKYLEAMASGCLVLAQRPKDSIGGYLEKSYGFVNGDNILYWDNVSMLLDLIRQYLFTTPEGRQSIARRGQELVKSRHTSKVRAHRLVDHVIWDQEDKIVRAKHWEGIGEGGSESGDC